MAVVAVVVAAATMDAAVEDAIAIATGHETITPDTATAVPAFPVSTTPAATSSFRLVAQPGD